MIFNYIYGEQSEAFSFYRTPQIFYTDERFRCLSSDAKTLYGILLDRVSLSRKNGWLDDEGRVFVYMTVRSIETALGCAHQKACGLLAELEEFGLIERVKQHLCKPDHIYVKNFIQVWNSNARRYENQTTEGMKFTPTEVCKSYSNNIDSNNNESNNTNPIISVGDEDTDADEREAYRKLLYRNLEPEVLYERYPYDRENIDAVFDLMLDVISSKRKTIRIAGDDKPAQVVRSQLLKLNMKHLEYILECMKNNTSEVRNIKQYMLAMIYNAPMTMNSYYEQMLNHDLAEGII